MKNNGDKFPGVGDLAGKRLEAERTKAAKKIGGNLAFTGGLVGDTDLSNCFRLVKRHGYDLAFTRQLGWLCWDGKRWMQNEDLVMQRAKDTALEIYKEIQNPEGMIKKGDDAQRAMFRHAQKSQSSQALKAMISLAQSEPDILTNSERFDTNPYLLNANNGTIDLRDGSIYEHTRENLITKLVDIDYDPDAECPLWLEFLDVVMAGDQEMIDYLQRVVGYSLSGLTGEQVLFYLYGTGNNGKSVFLETLQMLCGEYSRAARTETIVQTRGGGIPNDIARLAGARLVCISEVEDGQRLKESLIKDLTGGDTISARFLHKEFFDFRAQFKIYIRGNHKAQIRGSDDGIWRRLHVIPFTVKISPEKRDRDMGKKLEKELPGILNWGLQGFRDWEQKDLSPPEQVVAAVSEYRTEMDVLGSFLTDCTNVTPNAQVKATPLYARYQRWAKETGEFAVKQTRFGIAMTERGFTKKKTGGKKIYSGLELLTEGYRNDHE